MSQNFDVYGVSNGFCSQPSIQYTTQSVSSKIIGFLQKSLILPSCLGQLWYGNIRHVIKTPEFIYPRSDLAALKPAGIFQ
jgi:hypothetical protein